MTKTLQLADIPVTWVTELVAVLDSKLGSSSSITVSDGNNGDL